MALQFLTYLAPTPGSAGIAEGASLWIMGGIVPLGFAPYYNLLWRFSTVYLAAAAGLGRFASGESSWTVRISIASDLAFG